MIRICVALMLVMNLIACNSTLDDEAIHSSTIDKARLDSIELMHVGFACDCQHWVMEEEYNAYNRGERGQGLFDLDKYGYYIEPAEGVQELGHLEGSYKFYGTLRSENDWPKKADFIDNNPPKGKVFTYSHFVKL